MDNSYSLSDIAAASGDSGFGGANSWVLIILFALIFGWSGNGFGGNGASAATTADIQRAVDLNSIQQGQADIGADIQRTTYETMATVKDASYNNLGEIRDVQAAIATGFANQQTCCCETKGAIMENRYLDAQNTSAIQLAIAQQKADLATAIHAEGEATRSMMQQDKIEALQQKVSALELANAIGGVQSQLSTTVKYPTTSAYCSGSNPFCSCGCSGY